jgi:hypothetical protein
VRSGKWKLGSGCWQVSSMTNSQESGVSVCGRDPSAGNLINCISTWTGTSLNPYSPPCHTLILSHSHL